MNSIIIKGRLTKDPEERNVQVKGEYKTVCNFTVAVDRTYGEESDFFPVQVWGKTAEFVAKFFSKGQEILVQGSMECNKYEKNGEKKQIWQLAAQRVEFCGSKKERGGTGKSDNPAIPEGFQAMDDDECDIPF